MRAESTGIAYLDTSAFVKLVVAEPESAALRRYLSRWRKWAAASLLRTEAARALLAQGKEKVLEARARFADLDMIRLDDELLDAAGELDLPNLRSLDAIHLSAALALGDELDVLVSYDQRMVEAAQALGLTVAAPGGTAATQPAGQRLHGPRKEPRLPPARPRRRRRSPVE